MCSFRFISAATVVLVLGAIALPACGATEQVLHSFKSLRLSDPRGQLTFQNGSLFGTGSGLYSGYGQVFELTHSGGTWTESKVLKFDRTGSNPVAGLIQDSSGTFYGTTTSTDGYGGGTVFALSNSGGVWHEATLWSFGSIQGDGIIPECDLIMDNSGCRTASDRL